MSDQRWQSIETAPRDGTKFLVFTINGAIEITEWYVIDYDRYIPVELGLYRRESNPLTGWNSSGRPTHWMPLPPPPDHPRGAWCDCLACKAAPNAKGKLQ